MHKFSLTLSGLAVLLGILACSRSTDALTGGKTRIRQADGAIEVFVPAGEFVMGASTSDSWAEEHEFPQHAVTLDAFWFDQHEVTNGQYALCVATGACVEPLNFTSLTRNEYYGDKRFENYPVLYVEWDQASVYCRWVGGSLPTEAQWEKAARGTDGRVYPWGNQLPSEGLMDLTQVDADTTEVCSFPDGNSPYGVCDMAGNVWEWVNDWYDAEYYRSSPTMDPQGPESGDHKVIRGGSWFLGPGFVWSSMRGGGDPHHGGYSLGFRCVRP